MVRVIKDIFDHAADPLSKKILPIFRFTLTNDCQMSVQIITHGATVTSIKVPDASGKIEDVVLGYDNMAGYQTATNPYFGATIGRVCNRIANGLFTLEGREIEVTRNVNNKHQLHGGLIGFDKVNWEVVEDGQNRNGCVTLQHISPDGHEGYPGQVTATVHFILSEDNCLHMHMEAETNKTTAVNMTNHSYFNLAGHAAGREAIYAHSIQIKADQLTETDGESIPTGRLVSVAGTGYDLRTLGNLGERLQNILPANGYDDNFCVDLLNNQVTMIAKAYHENSGRWLEISSDQPGVQFYTSNFLPDVQKDEQPVIGKSGARYEKHGAFCLETQKYPDAANHPNFPSIVLHPGEKYSHNVIYKFGTTH